MKIIMHLGNFFDGNVPRRKAAAGFQHFFGGHSGGCLKMGHLSQGMHAAVRPSGTDEGYGFLKNLFKDFRELTLDSAAFFALYLPAVKICPVIFYS